MARGNVGALSGAVNLGRVSSAQGAPRPGGRWESGKVWLVDTVPRRF